MAVVEGEPGLYFVGPHFLYSPSSTMIHGIGRDARRVAETIARRRTWGRGWFEAYSASRPRIAWSAAVATAQKDLSIPAYAQCECR